MRFTLATLLTLLAISFMVAPAAANDLAEERLLQDFPGIRIERDGERVVRIHGRAMGAAPDRKTSTDRWLARYADVIDAKPSELVEHSSNLVGDKFTVYRYRQVVEGLPVEGSLLRVLVDNETRRVVYVSARDLVAYAPSPSDLRISAQQVLGEIRGSAEFDALPHWSEPTLVLLPGRDGAPATPAWKLVGGELDRPSPNNRTVYFSARDASLLLERDNFVHFQSPAVSGTVEARATPGMRPDLPSNPPTLQPILGTKVSATNCSAPAIPLPGQRLACVGYTNDQGVYAVGEINAPARITSHGTSEWFLMPGIGMQIVFDVVAPATLDFTHNDPANPSATNRANVTRHGTMAHDFYKQRQPDFDAIDQQVRVEFGDVPEFACNAGYFQTNTLQTPPIPKYFYFANSGPESAPPYSCPSQAFSSVIGHEYGHFVQDELGLLTGIDVDLAFGEGFAESFATLLYNDPVTGLDAFGEGTGPGRDTVAANEQYPCSGTHHACGLVLSGVWWDLKLELEARYGAAIGLAQARQLFTDWSQIAALPGDGQSAVPATAVEVLTADDDDADLCNETPHWAEICSAFQSHSIACPDSNTFCP